MRNPTRRNKNIGTANQGFGQNNKLTISSPYANSNAFYERLNNYSKEKRIINNHEFTFVIEQTRANSKHCCSINDLEKIIEQIPNCDYGDLSLIILRQAKRKEETISPVWGRLIYSFDFEDNLSPAIVLEAIELSKKLKWTKNLSIESQKELERLKEDGFIFEETKRDFITSFEFEQSRNTQLYRTLLHEFGHYVHYLETVERPAKEDEAFEDWERRRDFYFKIHKDEKEKFAHNYANKLKDKLIANKIIPFEPL